MQTFADTIHLLVPQRVLLFTTCLEVHIQLKLRQTARHESSVTAEDVTAYRLYIHTVSLQTVGHLHPVVTLHRSGIERLTYDHDAQQDHQVTDDLVARYDFLSVEETAHDSKVYI